MKTLAIIGCGLLLGAGVLIFIPMYLRGTINLFKKKDK